MFFTRVLNVVRKHTNEFTGIIKDSPDRAYGRRKIKMMTAHYYGRGKKIIYLLIFSRVIRELFSYAGLPVGAKIWRPLIG